MRLYMFMRIGANVTPACANVSSAANIPPFYGTFPL